MSSLQTLDRHKPRPPQTQAPVRARRPGTMEERHLILWIQAGWVGVALIAIAYLPGVKPAAPPDAGHPQRVANRPVTSVQTRATPSQGEQAGLFIGGSDSLVARAVGHAEGTRAPDGSRTSAYYGHTDPGNGVWNLGSFSFQHCKEARYNCSKPEEADVHQLRRLQDQTAQWQQRVRALKLTLSPEETLNGIDLANQAPLAVMSRPGYPEYLAQARKRGLRGQEAILEARVWSFWNPDKQRWDAAGLGNTEANIRHDQRRRMLAIARVLMVDRQPDKAEKLRHSQQWLQLAARNPYAFQTQRQQYLWWDAGYWDGRLGRGRQLPVGAEAAYDAGFQQATE